MYHVQAERGIESRAHNTVYHAGMTDYEFTFGINEMRAIRKKNDESLRGVTIFSHTSLVWENQVTCYCLSFFLAG